MKKIKIGIVGGAGYTGGELLRVLLHHPEAEIVFVHSRSKAGQPVTAAHPDLTGDTNLRFSNELSPQPDLLFLCLGHGESQSFLAHTAPDPSVRIIDLTQDHRLSGSATWNGEPFIYGLPECNRDRIRKARYIANPGCFATCIQLGLLPLAEAGLLHEIHTTAITGSTGAGQSLSPTSHFSWRAGNIQAYKTLEHQHLTEILETLRGRQPNPSIELHFVPWRGDFTRGIFASSTLRCDRSAEELRVLYGSFFESHPFIHLSPDPIYLKQVLNTNKAVLQLEKIGNMLVVHTAIDNLLKGAVGQAVQNMNLMFGLEETRGLKLKPSGF
ncbi:MAG: hypothetical protein RJA57_1947 [Bacteroidota bacterium]